MNRPDCLTPGRVLTPGARRDLLCAEIVALSELKGRITACASIDGVFAVVRDMCDERRMEIAALADHLEEG